ncbi:hypothetical protein [Streptosporangium roseum]
MTDHLRPWTVHEPSAALLAPAEALGIGHDGGLLWHSYSRHDGN